LSNLTVKKVIFDVVAKIHCKQLVKLKNLKRAFKIFSSANAEVTLKVCNSIGD
jgi:hypothetical protein